MGDDEQTPQAPAAGDESPLTEDDLTAVVGGLGQFEPGVLGEAILGEAL